MQRFPLPATRSLLAAFLLLLVAGPAPHAANALGIDVTSGTLYTRAGDPLTSDSLAAALPLSDTHSADPTGGFAQSTYDFSKNGGAVFDFDFVHSYSGPSARSAGSDGDIFFTLMETASYEFAGSYIAGSAVAADIVVTTVTLADALNSNIVYFQETDRLNLSPANTPVLTELDGVGMGSGGSASGSLTGTLDPGNYKLSYGYAIADALNFDGPASGSGGFTFTLVPEPSTALLLAAGLAAAGRRRSLH